MALLEDKVKESHEGVSEGIGWWNNVDGKEGHALPETFMRRKHVVRCVANKERWASLLGISVPDYCWLICIEKL